MATSRLTTRSKYIQRPWIRRSGAAAILVLLLVFVPAFTIAPVSPAWVPEPVALWAFDIRLLIGRPLLAMSSSMQALQGDPTVAFDRDGERVAFESNGLTIVGTLYGADGSARAKPGLLLLHGSTPQGRRSGLYRMMGTELAALDYVVLAIDQRGHGESDDPPDVRTAASLDFVADVESALAYLAAEPGVDPERMLLVGHSFGGDVALTAVADGHAAVTKLVLIGPSRHFMKYCGTPDAPRLDYQRRRVMRYMNLRHTIPVDVFLDYRASLPLENHVDYISQPGHVPLLFMDGELESEDDRRFLQNMFATATGVKAYVTLDDADHYANTANLGPLIVYDQTAMTQLVREIDTFMRQ